MDIFPETAERLLTPEDINNFHSIFHVYAFLCKFCANQNFDVFSEDRLRCSENSPLEQRRNTEEMCSLPILQPLPNDEYLWILQAFSGEFCHH